MDYNIIQQFLADNIPIEELLRSVSEESRYLVEKFSSIKSYSYNQRAKKEISTIYSDIEERD